MYGQQSSGKNLNFENESLKGDGHQGYQHQQNEQSPLILPELTQHKKDRDI
jgi:hypothetical protein